MTTYDLVVVGSGMAGCAAALSARDERIAIVRGALGETFMSSGLISLPSEINRIQREQALALLTTALPELGYVEGDGRQHELLSPLGCTLNADLAPASLAAGDTADLDRVTIVDLGVTDIDLRLSTWPLSRKDVTLEMRSLPVYNGMTCYEAAKHAERNTEQLVQALSDAAGGSYDPLCIPAVLGIEGHGQVRKAIENADLPLVFELPCPPPSVTGARLALGLLVAVRQRTSVVPGLAISIDHDGAKVSSVSVAGPGGNITLKGERFVLATGGLISRGLVVSRQELIEPLTGNRAGLLQGPFDPETIQRSGLDVDAFGHVEGFTNLRAAGALIRTPGRKDLGHALVTGIRAGSEGDAQ